MTSKIILAKKILGVGLGYGFHARKASGAGLGVENIFKWQNLGLKNPRLF